MSNRKRLKILYIPAWYPSKKDPVNGIFIKEHAKAAALYNDIVVLYNEGIDFSVKYLFETEDNIEEGIRTLRFRYRKSPIPKTTYFIYLWSIFMIFRKLMFEGWRPDIIHAHVFSAGISSVILGKIYKIPVVITEHCTNIATHSLKFFEILKLQFAMNKAKLIFPVSRDLKQTLEDHYNVKSRFVVVPNVINTKIYYPLNISSNKKKKQKKMLTVCCLTSRKCIDYLLNSLYQLKQKRQDFTLDVIGDGPDRKEYERLTKELGLDKTVKFYGRLPKIVSFIRNCNFFVLPSLYENFGVVYIEAMACGKPVIATDAGGPKEFINKDVGILVPPRDLHALVEAINYMLNHYQDYSSKKISQYAKENFSYEIVGKRLDKLYRSLM